MAGSKKPQFTEADGRQLAVDMLREIEQDWYEVSEGMSDAEAEADPGGLNLHLARDPQILRRYLAVIERSRSAALSQGFLAVVSEFIGSALNDGRTDLEQYEALAGL